MKHFDRLKFSFKKEIAHEVEARRTFYGKLFKYTDGSMGLRTQLGTPIHFREETLNAKAPMLDIDLEPQKFSDRWEFNNGLYRLTVTDTGEVQYRSRAYGDLTWKPIQIGGSDRFSIQPRHETRGIREFIVFEDIRPGVDLMIRVGSAKMEPLFRVKHDKAPREFLWEIDQSEAGYFRVGAGGRGWEDGAKGRKLALTKTDGAPLLENGRRKMRSEEVWGGEVIERGKDRKAQRKRGDRFPVIIDPPDVSEAISAGLDDVSAGVTFDDSESNPWFNSSNSFLSVRFDGVAHLSAGFRFRSLAVPNGQGLSGARLHFLGGGGDGIAAAKIFADDVDDAALWSSGNGPGNITKTAASAPFTVASDQYQVSLTATITAVVAEVVARSGWVSGNDLRLAITPGDATVGRVAIIGYENTYAPGPARLELDFALPPATGSIFKSGVFG